MNPHRFAAGLFALTLFLAMLAVLLLGSPRVRAVSTGFSGVVIDANATPLANIDVLLWRRTDSANGAIWAFTNVSTKTAPSGLFSLVIPMAGEYVLEFADPSGEYLKEFYDDKLSAAEAAPFLIEVGDSVVVTGTLARSGKISGVVTSAVAPYQPLDDINVSAWREGVGGWQDATVATTDSDGKYTIAGLRTGTYRLQFTSIATAAFFTLYYPNQPILEEAESIPVEAGELITGFDAALEPKSEVRGRILPPAGKSAEDYSACLTATNPQIDPWTLAPLECALLNPTGPNGDYHFSPLHAGEYQIYFGDSRLPPRVAAGWYAAADSLAPSLSGATSIEVSTGVVVTAATVTLEPTYSIVGEVRMPNATNAEDAEVRVYREDGEIWRWWHTTHTRAEGKLVYAIPHAGVYTVGIFADGMAPRYHAVSTTFADSTITQVPTDTVTVPAVQVVENVVAGGFVNGLVVDQGGAPLPGMEVHLFLWDAHTEESDNVRAPEWLRSTTTDEAGAYLLDGLGDESVWLLARDPAGALADIWYPGPPSRPNAPPLTITGTETVLPDLVMAMPASAITVSTVALSPEAYGIVRDRDTDESIPNATISLYWLPGWRARLNPRDFQAQTCPSAESEGVQIPTGDAANAFAGKDAFAGIGMFAPDASSILSDGAGRFGWRLTPGCWYLHASAQGYRDIWSPVWGVASDEDNTPQWVLALEPLPVTPTPETPTPETPTPETPTPETPTPETPTPETPTPETPTLETITPVTPTVEATISPSPSISPVSTPNPGIPPSITPLPTTHTPVPPLTPVVAETATPPPPMPTRVPTQPAETATPPMTVFVYGTLFNDSNWNQTQEVGEEGIAGMVLELTRTGNLTETVTAEGIAGSWRREATTSEQGAYLFTVVPPGRYTLSITPPEGIVLRSSSRLWLTIDESSDRLLLPIGVSAAGAFVLLPLILR